MRDWSRRAVLAAAAAGALSACTPSTPSGAPASRTPLGRTAPGPRLTHPAPAGSSSAGIPWSQLARNLDGDLVRPGAAAYARLRQVQDPRYDAARPLALAEVASAKDVATVLRFAADHGVPVAIRSGGHSYPGWSAGGGRLLVDCRQLSGIRWQGTEVTMGPGRHLADVYAGVAGRGRAIPGGSCPTVGLGGLTLGGGVGVLTRAYGLTCDHLTAARVVLASGEIVTASRHEHPDLLWALRGGGGGHIGVTTSLIYTTVAAPTLVTTYLTWPAARAAHVVPAWFEWIGAADARAWSTLKLLSGAAHPSGMSVGATVTWVGPAAGFDAMLAPLLATRPTGRFDHTRPYLAAMQAYGGSGGPPQPFSATSHVAYAAPASLGTLVSYAASAPSSLHEGGISIDALGGHVGDIAPGDTAFVHRKAHATVQYTATYDHLATAPAADRWVRGFRAAMTPAWGNHAYVNYADARLTDPGTAYFGSNWPRLQQVRATYDPHRFFTQPQ